MPDNTKSLNVRLKLKYDSYENWHSNNPQLLAGEVAVVYIPTDKSVDVDSHVLAGTQPPHILMKVGDGANRFDDLQWVSAKAADVNSYAKLTAATFETQIKALASAELSQSIRDNADAIDALEALIGSDTVTKQIADAITALDLANTYAAKEHTHTKADITDFAHTHTKADITDFAHTHTASEITDLDSTIKGYDYATKGELGDVDAKFADYKKAADQKLIDDEQDRRLGVIEGDYLKAADIANFETKENVKEVADNLAAYVTSNDAALANVKATAEAARTEQEVDSQIDAKITGLNLAQYTTEQEVKDIVDGVIAGAADSETYNSLTKLVDYIDTHGGEATEMAEAIETIEGKVETIENKPAYDITDTQVANWDGEVGAKALAGTKTTAAEVKAQIEAYGYATEVDLTLAENRVKAIEDSEAYNSGITATKVSEYDATKKTVDDNKETWDKADTALQSVNIGVQGQTGADVTSINFTNDFSVGGGYMDQDDAGYVGLAQSVKNDIAKGVEAQGWGNHANAGYLKAADISGKADKTEVEAVADDLDEVKATADTAVQTVTADTGLKATKTGTDVAIGIDEAITFVLDCGTSTI